MSDYKPQFDSNTNKPKKIINVPDIKTSTSKGPF